MSVSRLPFPAPAWIASNFRALLDAAPDAMLVVDDHGAIVFANLETEHLFGYSGSELLGRNVEVLVRSRFCAKHSGYRAGYLARNPSVNPIEETLDLYGSRKDGSEFSAETSFRPIQTPDGTMVISVIRDVSKRKQAEAQVRRLNDELEHALRRSDKLAVTGRQVATFAHEINNPLESLTNLLHLLGSSSTLDEGAMDLVEAAKQEVGRLSNLSRQTLAPHRETQLPVVTKISELLDDVLATFDHRLELARIKVRREYQTQGIVTIYPSELRQVFTNLITNAVDAMAECGELSLSVETMSDRGVAVRIADTGCGIPAENLGNIFKPFFTTKGEQGTGIGLWVTKSIVEKLGGTIEVASSTMGKKETCFSIFLPATNGGTHAPAGDVESVERKRA